MLRNKIFRLALVESHSIGFVRRFTASSQVMAEGDTGAPPRGGGQGDAFQRREQASENYAIQQREREKLLELKKKLAEQQENLKILNDHVDDLTKKADGQRS